MIRSVTAAVAGLVLALAGCGKAGPTKPVDDKGGTPTPRTPTPTNPGTGTPAPAGPVVLKPQDPAQQAAEKFVAGLRSTSESPTLPPDLLARVSPAFLKVIGKPTRTDEDKQRGYSQSEAEAWLRRAGAALTGLGLPTGYGTPTAAVFVGSFGNGTGRVLIRTVPADGGWKVDWFELGTAKTSPAAPGAGDAAFQDFAVQSFLDALTGTATPKTDRALLAAAVTTQKLRYQWAEPFAGDKAVGNDFNPTKLGERLDQLGGGVTAYTRTAAGADAVRVEFTGGGGPKAYTLKLARGPAGEWLVDEFTQ